VSDQYREVADLYDHVTAYRERPDVDFFVQAALDSGGPVLEIGCGTGRVLIPTARAGIDITGIDLSEHMLEVCRGKLLLEPAEVQARVHLLRGDMRDFALRQQFRLATLPFRPFQHLTTVEDQRACLHTIYAHLQTGGRVILDLFNPMVERLGPDTIGQEYPEGEFTTPDGRSVQRISKVVDRDRANQINFIELVYHVTYPDGRAERMVHSFAMRYLFRFEAEHLLTSCGFRVEQVFSDYDLKPFGAKYPGELILVAAKPA
jgi:SAM-dependent methyltransferase